MIRKILSSWNIEFELYITIAEIRNSENFELQISLNLTKYEKFKKFWELSECWGIEALEI